MPEDDFSGLTLYPTSDAPALDETEREQQIEAMVEWFHENYEDPAQETPYISAEGGYQYIWGGPYDAREELEDAFSGEADEDLIVEAVRRVERSGTREWAPSGNRILPENEEEMDHGDEDAGVLDGEIVDGDVDWPPVIAVPARPRPPAVSQDEVIARLDALERGLLQLTESTPPIGHNNPPEPISDAPPLTPEIQQGLRSDIQVVRTEIKSDSPNFGLIEKKAGIFRRMAARVGKWLGEVANKAITNVAGAGIMAAAMKYYPEIHKLLLDAFDAVMGWLPYPF